MIHDTIDDHAVVTDDLLRIALLGKAIDIFLDVFGGDVFCGCFGEEGEGSAEGELIGADGLEGKLGLCLLPPLIRNSGEASASLYLLCVGEDFLVDLSLGFSVKIDALVSAWIYDRFAEPSIGAGG